MDVAASHASMTQRVCVQVTEEGLVAIASGCTKLRHLDVSHTKFATEGTVAYPPTQLLLAPNNTSQVGVCHVRVG